MYFRLRGTHHAFGDVNAEIDDKGNPLVDKFGENTAEKAFNDLWFYSNPIFVRKTIKPEFLRPIAKYQHLSQSCKRHGFHSFCRAQTGTIKIMDMSGKCIMESGINHAKDEQNIVKYFSERDIFCQNK
jgi:hypothetical protein